MVDVKIKTYKWLLFTAVVAVLPLGLDFLYRVINGSSFTVNDLISAGQLFLVSCALAASGMGEILVSLQKTTDNVFQHVTTGFLGIVVILIAVGMYGFLSATQTTVPTSSSGNVTQQLTLSQNLVWGLTTISIIQIVCFFCSFMVGLYAQKFD